jgi:hypothetical protein
MNPLPVELMAICLNLFVIASCSIMLFLRRKFGAQEINFLTSFSAMLIIFAFLFPVLSVVSVIIDY